ncbi:MAG: tetratricopeptide repeat protein, partial [Desulfuromonadales bacterium]|nr:tetratricopeptide repeat protein [Desulfuromonadales bacterium]
PLVNRGNVLAFQERWDEAAADYRRALERDPGEAAAMNNLAWVLLQSGRGGEGEGWARRAVAARPEEPAFWDTLAEIQLTGGDPDGARQAAEQGLALEPPPELRLALESKRAQAMKYPQPRQ